MHNLLRNNNLFWPSLGICLALIGIPIFLSKISIIVLILSLLIIWMVYTNKNGYSIILIAMSLSIPGGIDSNISGIISGKIWYIFLAERLLIISIFIYQFRIRKKRIPFKNVLIIGFLLIILGYIYQLSNNENQETIRFINALIYMHFLFIICFWDNINLKNVFRLIDVLFVITAIYAILEYSKIYCPYSDLYMEAIRYEVILNEIPRAKGILGHPLVLSSITILYQTILITRLFLFKKINILLLLLCILTAILTTSRTTVILFLFIFCYYYIFSKACVNLKKNLTIFTTTLIIVGISADFLVPFISNISERFDDGADHRLAAYPSTFKLLSEYPCGVGSTQVLDKISRYSNVNLIKDFTLDNFFLTQLAAYGMFSIIVFIYYFYYFFMFYKKKHFSQNTFLCATLFFLVYCMMGFSFDIEAYIQITLLYYGFLGYLNIVLNKNRE